MGGEHGAGGNLLIGVGNPLRGDDGVAAVLLEELAADGWAHRPPPAEVRVVHQLTPELALALASSRRVLFVDACALAGTTEPWIEALEPLGTGALGGHQLDPPTLMALAAALYGWRGEGALLRMPAYAFPHGMGLSAPSRLALPRARELVHGWLRGG
jgi:hydrogenase maturation protease